VPAEPQPARAAHHERGDVLVGLRQPFERVEPVEHAVDRLLRLDPGERGAEAEVDALPEAEMRAVRAVEIEAVGLDEAPLVAIGRAEHRDHHRAGRDRDAAELDRPGRPAHQDLDRPVVAQHLLDEVRHERAIVRDRLRDRRLPHQREHAAPDQVRRRLVARDEQARHEARDLGRRQHARVVGRGVDQLRDDVVAGAALLRRDDAVEIGAELRDLPPRVAPARRPHRLGDRVAPALEVRVTIALDPEQQRDHRDRDPAREQRHEVDRLAGRRGAQLGQARVDDLARPGPQRGERPRREAARHDPAQRVVDGRVGRLQDLARVLRGLGAAFAADGRGHRGAREADRIEEERLDVGMARDQP